MDKILERPILIQTTTNKHKNFFACFHFETFEIYQILVFSSMRIEAIKRKNRYDA